jgi:DNA anti-recombination protein RmuC
MPMAPESKEQAASREFAAQTADESRSARQSATEVVLRFHEQSMEETKKAVEIISGKLEEFKDKSTHEHQQLRSDISNRFDAVFTEMRAGFAKTATQLSFWAGVRWSIAIAFSVAASVGATEWVRMTFFK